MPCQDSTGQGRVAAARSVAEEEATAPSRSPHPARTRRRSAMPGYRVGQSKPRISPPSPGQGSPVVQEGAAVAAATVGGDGAPSRAHRSLYGSKEVYDAFRR